MHRINHVVGRRSLAGFRPHPSQVVPLPVYTHTSIVTFIFEFSPYSNVIESEPLCIQG